MISGGPVFNEKKKNKEKSNKKGSKEENPEVKEKSKEAAIALLREFIKTEGKKKKPKLLWISSGCMLIVILVIAASFLIPLIILVKDAKDTVRTHLSLIKESKFDEAFKLCDESIKRKDFDIIAASFYEILKEGSYQVEDFDLIKKGPIVNQGPTVEGIIYSEEKQNPFMYKLHNSTEDGSFKIRSFELYTGSKNQTQKE